MKYHLYMILLILTLLSCKENNANEVQGITIPNNNFIKTKQGCKNRNYDTFKGFKLNGIKNNEFNINRFIEKNGKPDSIINEYYFYGKSNFLFDKDKLIAVQIVSEELYFDDFLSMGTSFLTIKNKFPCSFESRGKTEFKNVKCNVLTLYDDSFNKIRIYWTGEKILGITYMIDESDFDGMN